MWGTVTLAAAALFLGLSVWAQTDQALTIEGKPGDVTLTSAADLAVRNELAAGSVRWFVAAPGGGVRVPKGLEGAIRPTQGGLLIEVPLSGKPAVIWQGGRMTIRWATDASKPSPSSALPAPGDVFTLAAAPSYPLGPGDKIQVTVYNVEDMNQTVTVDPGSIITFPVLDKVSVQGLSVNELQKKLEDLLAQFVKSPQVNIQLIEYGSRFVNVLGQVRTPGRIPLKGTFKILDAISQAGGFQDNSGDVELQRRDAAGQLQTKVFSKEELLTGNEQQGNIYVQDQDVINVRVVKSVYVNGEVKNPGPFPYNKEMTLLRAITSAGGFTQWANKGRVDILREEKGTNQVTHVDAGDIERGKIPDVPLKPNDQVVVRERKFF
jgi:polysaccharide export outer membrane protein